MPLVIIILSTHEIGSFHWHIKRKTIFRMRKSECIYTFYGCLLCRLKWSKISLKSNNISI